MTDLAFNPVDAAVIALVGLAAWFGYRAGFISTMYSLASWIIAVAAGLVFQGAAGSAIEMLVRLPGPLASTLGFVAVVIAVESLFSMAGHLAIRPVVALIRRGPLSTTERLLGTIPAAIRSLFIVVIAIVALTALPVGSEIKAAVETSRTGRIVNDQVAAYQRKLGVPVIGVTRIGEDQTERLEFPDGLELSADPIAERQLFDLVNEERTKRGRAALAWDERLVAVAREHSQEMFRLKYFSHESPVAGSFADRIRAARIGYSRAGENLAYAQSVGVAHQALMDSEGHRDNILRPEFTRIGIGVISAGVYGRMITQLFITP
ncbi:MAG TPA: CvpA family protein [Candidatus Limnocylindria bacterium]|nr:CvpA family protein [Candidatus Limnocylindria bacterium]